MKNGRRNSSNQKRGRTGSTNNRGESIADGRNIRADDRSEPTFNGENNRNEQRSQNNVSDDARAESSNSKLEITDGYYFTPDGRIERIPDGYYIDNQNRLRKRRQRNVEYNTTDGNQNRDRTETGGNETEYIPTDFLLEKPLNVRGKKRRKAKEESEKLTVVTLLASATSGIFTSIALLTGHEHWPLVIQESKNLAEALSDCLDTLPSKTYAQIIAILEKWVPWVNLAFIAGAIIVPRITKSLERVEERYHPKDNRSNERQTDRTENNSFDPFSRPFWNN